MTKLQWVLEKETLRFHSDDIDYVIWISKNNGKTKLAIHTNFGVSSCPVCIDHCEYNNVFEALQKAQDHYNNVFLPFQAQALKEINSPGRCKCKGTHWWNKPSIEPTDKWNCKCESQVTKPYLSKEKVIKARHEISQMKDVTISVLDTILKCFEE